MASTGRRAARRADRERRLGSDAKCRVCGFHSSASVQLDTEGVICYECAAREQGRTAVEAHHPIGRRADAHLTLLTPGNLHREIEELKRSWPPEQLNDGDPDDLTRVILHLRATHDQATCTALFLPPIIDFLGGLRTALATLQADERARLNLPPLW